MRNLAAVLILFASLPIFPSPGPTFAGPTEDAEDAWARGDYTAAYRLYKPLAERGNAMAQTRLGALHYQGKGAPKDLPEAVKWFTKAAEQGHADAQTTLGYLYDTGMAGTQDRTQSVMWYRKAAEQGDPHGQLKLGEMYSRGDGVDLDYGQSLKWIHESAEQGYAQALFALAVMYWSGKIGVPKDHVEAYKWAFLSGSMGKGKERDEAERFLGIIAAELTPDQIAEAQRLAREWKPKKEW